MMMMKGVSVLPARPALKLRSQKAAARPVAARRTVQTRAAIAMPATDQAMWGPEAEEVRRPHPRPSVSLPILPRLRVGLSSTAPASSPPQAVGPPAHLTTAAGESPNPLSPLRTSEPENSSPVY